MGLYPIEIVSPFSSSMQKQQQRPRILRCITFRQKQQVGQINVYSGGKFVARLRWLGMIATRFLILTMDESNGQANQQRPHACRRMHKYLT